MSSLKTYLPKLAVELGTTPAALYERQRALVREGLLVAEPGRGPGSGVHLTAESVALLLIAILATDSLSKTGVNTRKIAEAKTTNKKPCPLTGKMKFKNALAQILDNRSLCTRVGEIIVLRSRGLALISFGPPSQYPGQFESQYKHTMESVFVSSSSNRANPDIVIQVQAGLRVRELYRIADELHRFAEKVGEMVSIDEATTK